MDCESYDFYSPELIPFSLALPGNFFSDPAITHSVSGNCSFEIEKGELAESTKKPVEKFSRVPASRMRRGLMSLPNDNGPLVLLQVAPKG